MKITKCILFLATILVTSVIHKANASVVYFEANWSGVSNGNSATATALIGIDIAVVPNPGNYFNFDSMPSWFDSMTLTISGASSGNGTFTKDDFQGVFWDTAGGTLDLGSELVGQATTGDLWGGASGEFNIFRATGSTLAPTGTAPFQLTPSGSSDNLILISFSSQGVSVDPTEGFTYTITPQDTVIITGYTGVFSNVEIPATLEDFSVNAIESWAFQNCIFANIIIPNSVTDIGDYAFADCFNLTSITIPNGTTALGEGLFFFCNSLTNITIADSVDWIGNSAFGECENLLSITLPDGITAIADSTFSGCRALRSITIPNSVFEIGDYAFGNCSSLTNITISTNAMLIGDSAFRDCSSLTNIFIPSRVEIIGEDVFMNCSALELFEVANDNAVYSSLDGVLFNKMQTTLISYPAGKHGPYTVPDSITRILYHAFFECDNLTSLVIPYGITTIEYEICFGCDGLASVTIPDSVTTVEYNAFKACSSLTEVIMPNSITSLGSGIFQYCGSLTNAVLPNSITTIPAWMFTGTKLTSITIPSTVTSIGGRAFAYDTGTLKSIYFLGNPPSLHTAYPFYQIHPDAVFYYMEGATGWGSSFGGFPTALWKPNIQMNDTDFGMNTNGFNFTLPIGPINYTIIIEANTNLLSGTWDPISTKQLSDQNADLFTDEHAANYSSRYYRITMP